MGEVLLWWAAIQVLGILGLPLTVLVLSRLPDRGWALARPLSLLAFGWLVWFPLALLPALPYSRAWIVAVLLLFALGNALLLRRLAVRRALRLLLARQRGYLAALEVLFFAAFAGMTWLRSFTPGVVDQEKFMDVAFLSAIWRAPHLPPPDPWLSGEPINYYYFGHFLVANLARLLGTVPAVAFNLGVGLIFALTAVAVCGVATNLAALAGRARRRPLLAALPAGLVAVAVVLVLGNLGGAQVWWEQAVDLARRSPTLLPSPWAFWLHRDLWMQYNWWAPSRVLPAPIIDEFPAFSFVLADLHAHVLALPFAALATGLALNLLLGRGRGLHAFAPLGGVAVGARGLPRDLGAVARALPGWLVAALPLGGTALALGGLYAINGWDLPTYLGLALLALAVQQWLAHDRRLGAAWVVDLLRAGALLGAVALLAYVPFYRGFVSPSQGIGFVPSGLRTPPGPVLAMFGLALFVLLSLLLWRGGGWLASALGTDRTAPIVAALAGGVLLLGAFTALSAQNRGWTLFWAFALVLGCTLVALHELGFWSEAPGVAPAALSRGWLLCLFGVAAALVAVCEVVYLHDVFGYDVTSPTGGAFRMNTVFKLYYQAWLLVGIAAGPALALLLPAAWGAARRALRRPQASLAHTADGTAHELAPVSGLRHAAQGAAPADVRGTERPARQWASGSTAARWPRLALGPAALRWGSAGGIVLWCALLVGLLAASAIYPVLAVSTRTQGFSLPRTLDGTAYMRTNPYNTGDAAAIAWLNAHVRGAPVLVEAADMGEYTYYGRISAFTGLPTLLGWGGHEYQWRVNWLQAPQRADLLGRRLRDVTAIYTEPDAGRVLALLHTYSARYLYVGAAERARYPGADLARFATFLRVVYAADGVTIYAVP